MKNTISLIGRSLIIGGGFGASIGQFLGQYAANQWQLIGLSTIVGIVISLVCVIGIYSVRPLSQQQLTMDRSTYGLSGSMQEKKAA